MSSFSNPFSDPLSGSLPQQIQVSRRQLRSYDVDSQSRLSLPALLRHLHDTAQDHASLHGFGFSHLQPRGLAWALVGLKLDWTDHQPLLRDTPLIICTTKVLRASGPVVYRQYEAASPHGAFVSGLSMWALIDLATRSTATPPPDLKETLTELQTEAYPQQLQRLRPNAEIPAQSQRMVQAHDCDFNGHLNNVVAVTWMLDALLLQQKLSDQNETTKPDVHPTPAPKGMSTIRSLHLTYIQEALWGQLLSLHFINSEIAAPGPQRIELRQHDGSPCVLMDLDWDAA